MTPAVVLVLLLQGIKHCGCKEVGNGIAGAGNSCLNVRSAEFQSFSLKCLTANFLSSYVVGGFVLLKGTLLSGEVAEAVVGFTCFGCLGRVENQRVVADGGAVTHLYVFTGEGEKEGLPAVTVCDGVENIQHDAVSVSHYLEEETAVEAEAANSDSGVFGNHRHLVQSGQIPPEETVLESASEGRDALHGVDQSLLENIDIYRLCESNAEPVDGGITLGKRSRIYVGGIVKPQA